MRSSDLHRTDSIVTLLLRLFICTLVLAALLPGPVRAEAARELSWKDLLPPRAAASETDNPFAKLTAEQRRSLLDLAPLRERLAAGEPPLTDIERADEKFLTDLLRRDGVDVDGLLAARNRMLAAHKARTRSVNPALDGQLVRMPGYLLPLETSGKRIREFLLVPWVGACIHTPPPPPNQIVHVTLDQPYEHDGLFKPVMVTGRMAARDSRRAVFVVDGTSDVEMSYVLKGTRVESLSP
jgi:hypothetical protein